MGLIGHDTEFKLHLKYSLQFGKNTLAAERNEELMGRDLREVMWLVPGWL